MKDKKLYRSRNDRVLTGLCGGIAQYFGIDSTIVRVGFVIVEFMTAGLLIVGYLIVALIVPKEPEAGVPTSTNTPDPTPDGSL